MREPANIADLMLLSIDYMGLIFYPPSPRYVAPDTSEGVLKAMRPDVQTVGVFVNEQPHTMREIAARFRLRAVQLHGDESPAVCEAMSKVVPTVIKAFRIGPDFDFDVLNDFVPCCNNFLFDTATTAYGGSGQKFDWQVLARYQLPLPYFLSGGIGPDDAEAISEIRDERLWALDLNSRFETSPAVKNIGLLRGFLHELTLAD